jgi:imidazoleglycerol phosphate dehydratase HisB
MKVIRSVIRITLIYVQTSKHSDIAFEHESEQDICIYTHTHREDIIIILQKSLNQLKSLL